MDNITIDDKSSNLADSETSLVSSNDIILEAKFQQLEEARKEYHIAAELVRKEQREVNFKEEIFGECATLKNDLTERRDLLNEDLREKRKEIRALEKQTELAKQELEDVEITVKDIRREIPKTRKDLDTAFQDYKLSEDKLVNAKQSLELASQELSGAEIAFQASGGVLQEQEIAAPSNTLTFVRESTAIKNNPWISGSFYLFAAVVLMTLLAVISTSVSWYALVVVFIGGLLAIAIVGALQLRNDETLSEENFLTLMIESFKRMPLLRGDQSPNSSEVSNEALSTEEAQHGLIDSNQPEIK